MSSTERRSQCKAPEPKVQRTVQFSCFVTAEYRMRSQGLGSQIFYCTICRAGKKRGPVCPQEADRFARSRPIARERFERTGNSTDLQRLIPPGTHSAQRSSPFTVLISADLA